MKKTTLTEAVEEVVALKMEAVDDYIKTIVEPLLDSFGNPEKLIGVSWDKWTPEQKEILSRIYGSALESFIAKKAIDLMRQHEAEVM